MEIDQRSLDRDASCERGPCGRVSRIVFRAVVRGVVGDRLARESLAAGTAETRRVAADVDLLGENRRGRVVLVRRVGIGDQRDLDDAGQEVVGSIAECCRPKVERVRCDWPILPCGWSRGLSPIPEPALGGDVFCRITREARGLPDVVDRLREHRAFRQLDDTEAMLGDEAFYRRSPLPVVATR